jgi:hypothetical protein
MGNCLPTEEFLLFKTWTSEIDIFVAIQQTVTVGNSTSDT